MCLLPSFCVYKVTVSTLSRTMAQRQLGYTLISLHLSGDFSARTFLNSHFIKSCNFEKRDPNGCLEPLLKKSSDGTELQKLEKRGFNSLKRYISSFTLELDSNTIRIWRFELVTHSLWPHKFCVIFVKKKRGGYRPTFSSIDTYCTKVLSGCYVKMRLYVF